MVTLAVPTLAVLQLGPCASCRAALGSVYSQGGRPAQWAPSHLPRVLELAASKAAYVTAFDHVGTAPSGRRRDRSHSHCTRPTWTRRRRSTRAAQARAA